MPRWLLVGAVLFVAGCGGDSFTAVKGTVTYDGKPLTNGFVTILPDGEGENASGQIGSDGRFTLTTSKPGDGVKPGKYKVRIASYQSEAKMNDPTTGKPAIPEKYFDAAKSGLTVTIAGKSQTLDLNLPKE
jgi:hypothetical protein